MSSINFNYAAVNARRQFNITAQKGQKSAERLASGYRINRASDDAAGLKISEKMRAQIKGLNQSAKNIQDAISYVQIADGALSEVHSLLQRMNELAIQAANATNTQDDRKALDEELQQLKKGMQHVFEGTTFNDMQIWPESSIGKTPVWAGTKKVQGVHIETPSEQRVLVTNNNYDKVASGDYKIAADASGISISWTDYDGDAHETTKIDWATFEGNGYRFQVADYFDPTDTELFDAGVPVFDFEFALSLEPEAVVDDIIKAINGTKMSSFSYVQMSGRFEDAMGNTVSTPDVSVSSVGINYNAAYASRENAGAAGYDFDRGTDGFAEATAVAAGGGNLSSIPANNTSDTSVAANSTDTWNFVFNIEGIGAVEAKADYIFYTSRDGDADDENVWWKYVTTNGVTRKDTILHYPDEYGENSLGEVMNTLTGDAKSATPGILSEAEGGTSDVGGTVFIKFNLVANNKFTYAGNKTGNAVGDLNIVLTVKNTDTEQTVLDKINAALNNQTILDLYTTDSQMDSAKHDVKSSTAKSAPVERDVFEDDLDFFDVEKNIQAGANAGDDIVLKYKCLRMEALGLKRTNVLTEDAAGKAINEVLDAIESVSRQRSQFGAYQNRLEAARAVNQNSAENVTASESRIRDADMAEEVLLHAKEKILMEVGQKMIMNATLSKEKVLELLS